MNMNWFPISFGQEMPLLWASFVALAAVACLLLVRSGTRSVALLLLRLTAFACVLAAFSQPYIEEPGSRSLLPVYLDISDSLDEQVAQSTLAQAGAAASADGITRLIPFAESPAGSDTRRTSLQFTRLKDSWAQLNIGQTNLEAALRHAVQSGNKHVLLVSDGFETSGSVDAVLGLLQQTGVSVYPFIPEQFAAVEETVRITQLHAPLIAHKDSTIEAAISIKNSLQRQTTGTLTVTLAEEEVFTRRISVQPDQDIRVDVPLSTIGEGVKEVVARFTPADRSLPASSARTFVSGEQREKVLLLNGSAEDAKYLEQVLTEQQFQLVSQYADDIASDTIADLQQYSVVVYNNIALKQLPADLATRTRSFVEAGGGFIMIGGNNSFGLGGYKDTSIESILPVHIVPPQKEKKRLNIAVQLVLDKSGSMKDNSKILYSKTAAVQVIESLKPDDYLGIIGFDSTPFELLPIAQVGDNREKAKKRVQLMFPGTTTNLLPALDLGRRRLELARAGRKHMIILTDGKIPDGPARRPYYLQLVDEMRRTGITVSTFMIGSEQDFILREMADVGGGAFYRTRNISNLPRLFLDDIKVSTGERTQKESDRYDVRQGDGTISSTDLTAFPIVRGYVQTKRKEEANLELVAYANRRAEPLLASWRYGQGTSIAYTSDVAGRWSYYWVGWPRFHAFWTDLLETAQGEDDSSDNIQYEITQYVQGGSLFLEATIFNQVLPGALQIELEAPDGSTAMHSLKSLALGHFQTRVDGISAGTYKATLLAGERRLTPVVFTLSGELFGERKEQGYNVAALRALASATGGTVNPSREQLLPLQEQEIIRKPVHHIFLVLALLLILLEIFWREVRPGRSLQKRRRRRAVLRKH